MINELEKLVIANAGSIIGLKTAMKKEKVEYVKIKRGLKTQYILRRADFGRHIVTL